MRDPTNGRVTANRKARLAGRAEGALALQHATSGFTFACSTSRLDAVCRSGDLTKSYEFSDKTSGSIHLLVKVRSDCQWRGARKRNRTDILPAPAERTLAPQRLCLPCQPVAKKGAHVARSKI